MKRLYLNGLWREVGLFRTYREVHRRARWFVESCIGRT